MTITVQPATADALDHTRGQACTRKPPPLLEARLALPLVVDLDALLSSRVQLCECIATLFFHHPRSLVGLLWTAIHDKRHFAAAVIAQSRLDPGTLPFHRGLLNLLENEKRQGRSLHLVTTGDEDSARRIVAHLALFESVTHTNAGGGHDGRDNAALLARRFPDGFIYAGASTTDAPTVVVADGAILVGEAALLAAKGNTLAAVGSTDGERASPQTWSRLLRFHQWSKNLLVLVPFLLSQRFMNAEDVALSIAAFLALGALASGTYIINDIADLGADRAHPIKCRRPIASGSIPITRAALASAILILIGIGASAWLSLSFAAVACGYLVLTLAYSLGLRRVPLLDTYVVGILLTLRVVGGMALFETPLSPWLISFSIALFTSLAMAKRHGELHRIAAAHSNRPTGRGYRAEDLPATLAFGVGSSLAALLIMVMYINIEAAVTGLYGSPGWLYFIPATLMSWVQRIWLLAHRGILDDDPVVFALRDPVSWLHGAACVACWILAMSG